MHVLLHCTHPLHGIVRPHLAGWQRYAAWAQWQLCLRIVFSKGALSPMSNSACCRWWLAAQHMLTSLRSCSTHAPLPAVGSRQCTSIRGHAPSHRRRGGKDSRCSHPPPSCGVDDGVTGLRGTCNTPPCKSTTYHAKAEPHFSACLARLANKAGGLQQFQQAGF